MAAISTANRADQSQTVSTDVGAQGAVTDNGSRAAEMRANAGAMSSLDGSEGLMAGGLGGLVGGVAKGIKNTQFVKDAAEHLSRRNKDAGDLLSYSMIGLDEKKTQLALSEADDRIKLAESAGKDVSAHSDAIMNIRENLRTQKGLSPEDTKILLDQLEQLRKLTPDKKPEAFLKESDQKLLIDSMRETVTAQQSGRTKEETTALRRELLDMEKGLELKGNKPQARLSAEQELQLMRLAFRIQSHTVSEKPESAAGRDSTGQG